MAPTHLFSDNLSTHERKNYRGGNRAGDTAALRGSFLHGDPAHATARDPKRCEGDQASDR